MTEVCALHDFKNGFQADAIAIQLRRQIETWLRLFVSANASDTGGLSGSWLGFSIIHY